MLLAINIWFTWKNWRGQNIKEGDFGLFTSKYFIAMNDKFTSLIVKDELMWLAKKTTWNKTLSLYKIVVEFS
jgi:hypothetical protein